MNNNFKLLNSKGAALLLLFFISSVQASAQTQTAVTDTITVAFLPALGYNTDLGLIGGGLYNRYHYSKGLRPYYSYLNIDALASTKGLLSAEILYNKPYAFNTQNRIIFNGYISRFLQDQFYGVGNYSSIETEASEYPEIYRYKSFSTGIELTLRRPLLEIAGHQLDFMTRLLFDYQTPFNNDPGNMIMLERPIGFKGGRTAGLSAGFILEARNNEFAATKGYYLNTSAEIGQNWMGSSYNYLTVKTEARSFLSFYLIREITFANRLFWQHTTGTTPYWKLAELGGELSMRGYPVNRFLDDNALYLNTELRTWLWEFQQSDFRLGGTLFVDVGRTFSNDTGLNYILNDLRYTYGFGGNASFFTNEFILRADIGFSEEGYGIYFTAGYMF